MASATNNREFTGKHMLWLMLSFFGVILVVNIYMMYQAVTTFRGEDVKQSYRQGLEYNTTLQKRARQNALDWSADLKIGHDQTLTLRIVDQNGLAVRGLQITGALKHPAETDLDAPLRFTLDAATGQYVAALPADITGKRWVQTKAVYANQVDGDDAVFETKNEIWLK